MEAGEMTDLLTTEAAAALLKAAHASGQPIAPLRERLPHTRLDDAYAIQEVNTRAWLAEGRRLVGRKIGLTSRAVQAQLGVDQPDFGMLFADMAVGDGEPVAAGRLIQPKVEAEVALVLGRDLTQGRHTYADLLRATEYALPAIEIVDSRIAHWNIQLLDTVADNASSGLFVLGGQARAFAGHRSDRLRHADAARQRSRLAGQWPRLPGQPAECRRLAGGRHGALWPPAASR